MRVCQFNFNNEVDTFEIHVEDDGHVIVPGENGPLAEYASVQQLAEIYAQARDVKPENLKNWTLLENGNVYSYVLRAGTAGVDVSEVEEQLEGVFQSLEGRHHVLSIARAKEEIMADGAADLTQALVHCTETEIARDIYDAMQDIIAGTAVTEGAADAVEAEEDTRSDLEKYLDEKEEVPGALNLIAFITNSPADTSKVTLLEVLQGSYVFSNVNSLDMVYKNAVNDAVNDGIGVNSEADAITVITQTPVGTKDEEMKNRLVNGVRMAHRDKLNLSVDIVGQNHIRHTAELINVNELDTVDLFVRDNVPYIVRFSDTVDAELEAERNAAAEREGAEVTQQNAGGYEDDYIPDEDDDDDDGYEEY